jgi:uncharacterized protein YkwD
MNAARARRGAAPLSWSSNLAQGALAWSSRCVFQVGVRQHEALAGALFMTSCSSREPLSFECIRWALQHSKSGYGENLAKFSWASPGCADAVKLWLDEAKYCPCTTFSSRTGHYTQIVWKATTAVGCGLARCGSGVMVTCRYSPAGNVLGQFASNV